MNCKQGDLAYIVSSELPPDQMWAAGHIGRCVSPTTSSGGKPAWVMDPMPVTPPGCGPATLICDYVLRPIGNPDNDQVDESARWLPPVPTVTGNEKVTS